MSRFTLFYCLLVLLLIFPSNYLNGQVLENKAEKVELYTKVMKPHSWYTEQLKLWKIEVEKNSGNADAWFNYYLSSRYAIITAYQNRSNNETLPNLDTIVDEMGKYIPNSFEYAYVRFNS